MTANVSITGTPPADPRERVKALAAAAEVLTRSVGGDPADAMSSLLCAAVKIALETTESSPEEIEAALKSALTRSVVAAGHWFAGDRQPSTLN